MYHLSGIGNELCKSGDGPLHLVRADTGFSL